MNWKQILFDLISTILPIIIALIDIPGIPSSEILTVLLWILSIILGIQARLNYQVGLWHTKLKFLKYKK